MDNGLFRSDPDIKKGRTNRVFPRLHNTTEKSVTTTITNTIRAAINSGSRKAKESKSARSLRSGAVTEIAFHHELTVLRAVEELAIQLEQLLIITPTETMFMAA